MTTRTASRPRVMKRPGPIIEAAIYKSDTRASQHLFGIREIQTVFSEVAAVLRFFYSYLIS